MAHVWVLRAGQAMTAPVAVSSRVVVAAAPDRVWQEVVDWAGQRRWIIGTRVHGGQGEGATVAGRTGIGPLGFTDTMVITRWEPPRRCVVHHTGWLVRGDGIFEVAVAGTGSEFTWTEQLQLPLGTAGGLAGLMIRPLLKWGMGMSLRRFARLFPPASGDPR
jgi:carbon monoxide dehydrogenase subunit G